MKTKLLTQSGAGKELEMPACFTGTLREDIAQKTQEAIKSQQPYAPYKEAGKQHSASGVITHGRRLWKTAYGKGLARMPRKALWRRGDQFYWVGAEVNNARGGRRAHPPRVIHFEKKLKINSKEKRIALITGIISTCNSSFIKKRYASQLNFNLHLPLVVDSATLSLKTKDFFSFLKSNLGESYTIALKSSTNRAGIGKSRGRRYKENAGLLLVIGSKEKANFQGIDVTRTNELSISDLWPLGRLTLYSEQAVKELGEKLK